MTEFAPDPPAIQEVKLFHPIKSLLELGRKAVELAGLKDPPLYASDHYKRPESVRMATVGDPRGSEGEPYHDAPIKDWGLDRVLPDPEA